ncbi:MAG TPA: Zn-ribbon domain-containing OB-fold protein [Chloroflexota bacterium]
MAEYTRPLPVPDGDTKPFWDAAKEHRLTIQRCQNCHEAIFYPRSLCPHCMSDRIEWIAASGKGTIYSYTVVHQSPAAFADIVPYVVALINLDEGVRLMSRVVDSAPADVKIGAPVEVVFEDVTPEISLPQFRLA